MAALPSRSLIAAGWSRALLVAGVALHVACLASLATHWLDPLFHDAVYRHGQGADFYSLYQAGHNVIIGRDVYADPTAATVVVPYGYPYRYLPSAALTLGVASQVASCGTAYRAWVVATELMLLACILMSVRRACSRQAGEAAAAAWLLFTPLYIELYMGQFSFAQATLVMAALTFWHRGEELRGAACWTGSILLKSWTAVFGAVLVRQRRWRTLAGAGLAVVAVNGPYFARFPGSLGTFAHLNFGGFRIDNISGNQGLAAFVASAYLRLSGRWPSTLDGIARDYETLGRLASTPVLLLALVVVALSLFVTFRAPRREAGRLVLLWTCAYFLFYKEVWEHHYVMLLPVFAFLVASGDVFADRGLGRAVLAAFVLVALPTPLALLDGGAGPGLPDPDFRWGTGASLLWHGIKPLGALILYLALARDLLRRARADGAPRQAAN